jgi:hypothetical protein
LDSPRKHVTRQNLSAKNLKKAATRNTKLAVGRQLTKRNPLSGKEKENPQTDPFETGLAQNKPRSAIQAGNLR